MDKVIHWELCKKLKFDHTNKWYMHNPESVLENETYKLLWHFEIQTDHLISAWRLDFIIINKKMRIFRSVNFFVPADHRVKMKENKKKDKHIDLTRELKKLWNMKVTFIPVVIGAIGTLTKGLVKGLEDIEITEQVETLLRSARILRRVLKTWEICCHSNSSERPSAIADVKTLREQNTNKMSNLNIIQRGNQATGLGVMIGRCSPDSPHGEPDHHANVGCSFFRYTNDDLRSHTNQRRKRNAWTKEDNQLALLF